MASKRLLLYASDTYRLSSLLLRRVLLTHPITLSAYREKTRQLLLDTSRSTISVPNVAAIKLLEWDRELNLMQYHGVQEYGKRWWASSSWSKLASRGTIGNIGGDSNSRTNDTQTQSKSKDSKDKKGNSNKKNVARVAFMITSEQRHKLTTNLGYTPKDIRTFKPIEALLLLEHNVQRQIEGRVEYDFRVKLDEIVKENESLSMVENEDAQVLQSSMNGGVSSEIETSSSKNNQQSISPEDAQQVHAKPDVAMALLSVDKENARGDTISAQAASLALVDVGEEESLAKSDDTIKSASAETNNKHQTRTEEIPAPEPPSALSLVEVTPNDSEELHMKPDVAAAVLTSHAQSDNQSIQESSVDGDDESDEDGGCWYEVVEKLPIAQAVNADGGEQVIALFSTKKEARECVSIKASFRKTRQEGERSTYFVRRRWNV